MAQSEEQSVQTLDLDVVMELERIVRQLGNDKGQVTLEAVFSNGLFVRGFVKRGPIQRDEMRELGTR